MSEIKNTGYWGELAVKAISDPAALTELYAYYFPRVYQYLLGRTKDSSLADELVSDTFVRMYQHLEQFDPAKGAFSTWLFRIAQNVLNKYYGSKSYALTVPWEESFDPADEQQDTPEGQALTRERTEELRVAILQLPKRQQKILEMAYWLEMNSTEIAAKLDMAPSSVRVALKQARDALRKILQKK